MSYAYNYRVDGTQLSTYCQAVRMDEGVAPLRADRLSIPYEHGAYAASRNWLEPRLARLDTFLAGGTSTAVYQNLHAVTRLLLDGAYLQRSDPDAGEVRAKFRVMDGATHSAESGHKSFWQWPVWLMEGGWEDNVATSEADNTLGATATLGPFTVTGSRPCAPTFTITCAAGGDDPRITNPATGEDLYLPGTYATSDVIIIDCHARTITLNGNRSLNALTINRGWWMQFDANSTPSLDWTSTSGTWDVTTSWRSGWH